MQCHWDQTTIEPIHLPRKTAITDNTGGERGREGEKQTRRDGKTGGGERADGEKQKQEDRERRSTREETREASVKRIVCSQCRGQG